MDKIYLVIIDIYHDEENSIVNICKTKEQAKSLMDEYSLNGFDVNYSYHIDEVDLNQDSDILWDCYYNSNFRKYDEVNN